MQLTGESIDFELQQTSDLVWFVIFIRRKPQFSLFCAVTARYKFSVWLSSLKICEKNTSRVETFEPAALFLDCCLNVENPVIIKAYVSLSLCWKMSLKPLWLFAKASRSAAAHEKHLEIHVYWKHTQAWRHALISMSQIDFENLFWSFSSVGLVEHVSEIQRSLKLNIGLTPIHCATSIVQFYFWRPWFCLICL